MQQRSRQMMSVSGGVKLSGKLSRPTFTPGLEPGTLYVWGAKGQQADFYCLDINTREWSVIKSTPSDVEPPGPRHTHTATRYDYEGESYIAIYGGYNDEYIPQVSVVIYHMDSCKWVARVNRTSHWNNEAIPLPRSFHSATYVRYDNEPYLFVVGGLHLRDDGSTRDRNWVLPELCVLNLRTKRWFPATNVLSVYGHATVLLDTPRPRLLIIGGRDARGTYTATPYTIDIKTVMMSVEAFETPFLPSLEQLAAASDSEIPPAGGQSPLSRAPWRRLGLVSSSANFFFGPVWAEAFGKTVYVFGRPPAEAHLPQDLLPDSAPDVPYRILALQFDNGCSELVDVSSGDLRFSTEENWLWFGVVNSGLQSCRARDLDDIDSAAFWKDSSPLRFLAGVATKGRASTTSTSRNGLEAVEGSPLGHLLAFCLPVPSAFESSSQSAGPSTESLSDSSLISFHSFVPPLWHPSTNSASPPTHSPDITITTDTETAPSIQAHSLILASRSQYFKGLLNSGLIESSRRQSHLDEPYIVVWSLLYYLYTNSLPPFLSNCRKTLEQQPNLFGGLDVSACLRYAEVAPQIAALLLVASDKYLAPVELSQSLRHAVMTHFMHPSSALHVWNAANHLKREIEPGEETIPSEKVVVTRFGQPVLVESNWPAQIIVREDTSAAMRARQSPENVFHDEVSRWCYRRLDEIVLVQSEQLAAQQEVAEEDVDLPELDEEVLLSFLRDMKERLGHSRKSLGKLLVPETTSSDTGPTIPLTTPHHGSRRNSRDATPL